MDEFLPKPEVVVSNMLRRVFGEERYRMYMRERRAIVMVAEFLKKFERESQA